jgi:predicted lipoprotein with Yx(FWY)xxD motif
MKLFSVFATLFTTALVAGCAAMGSGSASSPARVSDGTLVNPSGMTLYTFDRDAAGSSKSACNGTCIANWPALTAQDSDKSSGDWSVVTRDDGKKQWAYKGKPLYTWVKDQKPGDKTGEGVNNVWHVARP